MIDKSKTTKVCCGTCRNFVKERRAGRGAYDHCLTQNVREGWGAYTYMPTENGDSCTAWDEVNV